jgi:amidohydrolase
MYFITSLDDAITDFISKNSEELILQRRWFHQHPETSFKEFNTSGYIQNYLKKQGISKIRIIAGTGVICEIGNGNPVHAARFNMDALPIHEESDVPFRSLYNGYSHSCGHDFELAWGLLIAKYFQENKPNGTIRLIFQPAEEGPGEKSNGKTGGQILAELEAFNVDSVMSLHVEPEISLNTISITDGEVTCDAFDFDFVLQGKTCHAAKPHQGLNPIPVASEIVTGIYALQEKIKSKITDDEGFILITVSNISSRFHSEKKDIEETINTIPEFVVIKGISRVRSKPIKEMLFNGFAEIEAKYKNELHGCILNIRQVAVATINDKTCVRHAIETAIGNNFSVVSKRTTWRDDAGWASQKAPSAHGFVGIYDGVQTSLHSPGFNPNEKGLEIGLKIFIGTLERHFKNFNI